MAHGADRQFRLDRAVGIKRIGHTADYARPHYRLRTLIARGRDAQWRPCRIETGALEQLDGWVATYRKLWTGKFDRMDAYLAQIQKGKPNGPRQ